MIRARGAFDAATRAAAPRSIPVPPSPLQSLLDRAVRAMWPRRSQQELLLDLGERKGWRVSNYDAALAAVCGWLEDELGLGATQWQPPEREAHVDLATVRDLGTRRGPTGPSGGVAMWAEALGPAVGATPKTLANSLARGLRPDRSDHRWLVSIARASRSSPRSSGIDAWLYHRRSPTNVSCALASLGADDPYDAGDALLVVSLLALWQRRRPTQAARSNKGRLRSRRETPKPVAALAPTLASPGQLPHLLRLARTLPGGRDLALLGLEAALTEAHLAPHAPRRGGLDTWDGETWLRAAESEGRAFEDLIGRSDAAVIAFRIERMRAWRERRPSCPIEGVSGVPYVEASLALEAARAGAPAAAAFSVHTPGLLMLLPLLRNRGFEILP